MSRTLPEAEVMSLLRQLSPFNSMDEHYLQQLESHLTVVKEPKGALLFKRGKHPDHRYYLIRGRVELINARFDKETVGAGDERALRALNEVSPTNVSARTLEDVTLLLVEASFLDLAMAWSESAESVKQPESTEPVDELAGLDLQSAHVEVTEERVDWMSGLLASPLFARVPAAHIQQLIARFETVEIQAGQAVIREGEAGDYFYVIDQGKAVVRNIAGNLQVTLKTGQFFGEEALVADSPRNATVTMLTDGTLMRLSKEDFSTLMHEPVQKVVPAAELAKHSSEVQLIDVRMPIEYRSLHVPHSRNIPLSTLRRKLPELDRSARYVITDDGGCRSQLAAYLFCQAGLDASLLSGAEQLYNAS